MLIREVIIFLTVGMESRNRSVGSDNHLISSSCWWLLIIILSYFLSEVGSLTPFIFLLKGLLIAAFLKQFKYSVKCFYKGSSLITERNALALKTFNRCMALSAPEWIFHGCIRIMYLDIKRLKAFNWAHEPFLQKTKIREGWRNTRLKAI